MTYIIREALPQDKDAIYQIHLSAFGQDSEAKLVNELRDDSNAFVPALSLVATYQNRCIGHILLTRIHILDSQGVQHESLALAPMAVTPSYQNQNVGSHLVKDAVQKAKSLGFASIIVLGHPEFYKRFGFQSTTKWQINAPFDVPKGVFMGLELIEGALDNLHGTVVYSASFNNVI